MSDKAAPGAPRWIGLHSFGRGRGGLSADYGFHWYAGV